MSVPGTAASPEAPAATADPYVVADWWATLAPEQRRALIQGDPDLVGALDGLPAMVRHEANMLVLYRELDQARDAVGRLDGGRLDEAERRLELLETVGAQVTAAPDRTLLLLDTAGEGRAAVAIGDVDAAEHVAVMVPGMGTTVAGDLDQLVSDAQRLHDTAGTLSPGVADHQDVAAIAWLGYDTPGGLLDATSDDAARTGAEHLTPALHGLQAARDAAQAGGDVPDLHLTVAAHSYGSVTAGLALREDTPVDDAVFLGSPGVGADHAGDLNVPDGHVFVGEARWDPVADLTHFGPDPSDDRFGAREFATGGTADPTTSELLRESTWHEGYFDDGSSSLQNQAYVTLGRDDLIIPGESDGLGDLLAEGEQLLEDAWTTFRDTLDRLNPIDAPFD